MAARVGCGAALRLQTHFPVRPCLFPGQGCVPGLLQAPRTAGRGSQAIEPHPVGPLCPLLRGHGPCSQRPLCDLACGLLGQAQSFYLESGVPFIVPLQGGGGIVLVPGLAINESKGQQLLQLGARGSGEGRVHGEWGPLEASLATVSKGCRAARGKLRPRLLSQPLGFPLLGLDPLELCPLPSIPGPMGGTLNLPNLAPRLWELLTLSLVPRPTGVRLQLCSSLRPNRGWGLSPAPPHPHSINENESPDGGRGPWTPALALCGQKSTSYLPLPGEASQEASRLTRGPCVGPPTSCLGPTVGSYCRVGAQKRDGKWRSLKWEVGGNPVLREGPLLVSFPLTRACLRSEGEVATDASTRTQLPGSGWRWCQGGSETSVGQPGQEDP